MATEQLVDFSKFNQDEIRTLQMRLLNILDVFVEFCNAHGLRYYLTGGTLLGAIRHKGFIPWDDDVDVAMPREDFEKLFKLWDNQNNRYQLLRPSKEMLIGVHIAQLRDSETTCIYPYTRDYDICHGIKIDIEPIDGCPDGKLQQKMQIFYCRVYALMAAQRIPNQASEKIKKQAKVILSIVRSKKLRYWLFHFAEKQLSKYKIENGRRVCVVFGYIFNKEVFKEQVLTEFEGRMFAIPNGYETYLKLMYKDYMKLPPEEDRKPKSIVYYYDPDTSYKKYKGIKYCVK